MDEGPDTAGEFVQLLLLASELLPSVLPSASDASVQQIDQVHKENLRRGIRYSQWHGDVRLRHGQEGGQQEGEAEPQGLGTDEHSGVACAQEGQRREKIQVRSFLSFIYIIKQRRQDRRQVYVCFFHRVEKNMDGSQSGRLAQRDSSKDLADQDSEKGKESSKTSGDPDKENSPVLKYLKTQVKDIFHAPLATMVKGAAVMTEELFVDVLPVAWELLLESNQEVAASAASLFIVAAVRAPNQASELMHHGLEHSSSSVRINAILRFQVLWKLRHQVWPRMEENAHVTFKVPPPGIEFTLPSPKIGIESLPVVDPPWMPQVKTKVEEVTINQEHHVSLEISVENCRTP